jgi:hypothetical protein
MLHYAQETLAILHASTRVHDMMMRIPRLPVIRSQLINDDMMENTNKTFIRWMDEFPLWKAAARRHTHPDRSI